LFFNFIQFLINSFEYIFKLIFSLPPHEIPLSSHLQGFRISGAGHKQKILAIRINDKMSLSKEKNFKKNRTYELNSQNMS
jgi:hypothetical protein